MPWPRLLGALASSIVFCVAGVVLLLDYRGLAGRHARATVQMFRPTRPSQSRDLLERRVRYQLVVDRVVGGAFALGGAVATLGILAHVVFA